MTSPNDDRQSWSSETVRRVAAAVRHHRGRRSAQWLADRTVELGYPMTRAVISDLEVGRRYARLDVAELLVLAAALDVAPAHLLYPGVPDERVEALPEASVSSWAALEWFTGEAGWDGAEPPWLLRRLRQQRMLVDQWRETATVLREVVEVGVRYSTDAAEASEVESAAIAAGDEAGATAAGAARANLESVLAGSSELLQARQQLLNSIETRLREVRDEVRASGGDPGALPVDVAFVDTTRALDPARRDGAGT